MFRAQALAQSHARNPSIKGHLAVPYTVKAVLLGYVYGFEMLGPLLLYGAANTDA